MASNAGFLVGWTRAFPGKEAASLAKFGEYLGWLASLQAEGRIDSFEPVLLNPHAGDLNGFVLVRGEAAKLDELRRTETFQDWVAWGAYHMNGFGIVDAYVGDGVAGQMARFAKLIQG